MLFKDILKGKDNNSYYRELSFNNYKMPYQIKVGTNSNIRKVLFILHGHGANKNYAKFAHDDWIVVSPLDLYGTDGLGSWWLGEKGQFFTFKLLQELITRIKQDFNPSQIFFWGSSMGGYGALLHGTLCNANAVYAHMSQVKLKGTTYTDGINRKYYYPIFDSLGLNNKDLIYQDLTKFLLSINKEKNDFPVYFLSQNVFDYPDYVAQHFIPLIQVMDKLGLAYGVEMNLEQGHKVFRNIANTVENIFLPNLDKINEWKDLSYKIKRDILSKIKINVSQSDNQIIVELLNKIENVTFACYLFAGNTLIEKKKYQISDRFIFSFSNSLDSETIKVRYFVRSNKNKQVRASKVFTYYLGKDL